MIAELKSILARSRSTFLQDMAGVAILALILLAGLSLPGPV